MFKEILNCEVKSCSAGSKTITLEDGSKEKLGIINLSLETDCISYESMPKLDPNIASTILNITPMPFHSVDFGEFAGSYHLEIAGIEANRVEIKNITVVNKDNIPTFKFKLQFPAEFCPDKAGLFNLKGKNVDFMIDEVKHD